MYYLVKKKESLLAMLPYIGSLPIMKLSSLMYT